MHRRLKETLPVRVDDWNEDPGAEPESAFAAAPAPAPAVVPPAPRPVEPPLPPPLLAAAPADAAAVPDRPAKLPFRTLLPFYLIAIVSIGMICVMFLIILALIAARW